MYPTLFRLAKEVGDYIRWQIQMEKNLKKYKSIVLFEACNMCRNYMKCYSEQYPPIFTCDNNSKVWGTEFEGLTVKNPEELKNLTDDCGVYICNIYYREIEIQLREMGIKNIEYFNDEYMPTFYFGGLEWEEEWLKEKVMGINKQYILYGIGGEAERFIFSNIDILREIKLYIDKNRTDFYRIPVCKLLESEKFVAKHKIS